MTEPCATSSGGSAGGRSTRPGMDSSPPSTAPLVEATGRLGIELRVGLHTGECEIRGDRLGGLAVHIAARVGASATSGEVLVSGTVKDLVVGSGIEFTDHGEHELKGVPGSWKLFAVEG